MSPEPTNGRERTRFIVDIVVSAIMVAAAASVLWTTVLRPVPKAPEAPSIPIPEGPVSFSSKSSLGTTAANVVIVEFSDFQCPYCGRFAQDTLPALKRQYVDSGLVQLAFRHLPLVDIHPAAERAALAADCAAHQDRFWKAHDDFFQQPARLALAIDELAANVDGKRFAKCMADPAQTNRIKQDIAVANGLKIVSTPTFLIGRRLTAESMKVSSIIRGNQPLAAFRESLDPLLR